MDARRIGIAAATRRRGGLFVACLVIVLLCFAFAFGLCWAGASGSLAPRSCIAGRTFLVLIGVAGVDRRTASSAR